MPGMPYVMDKGGTYSVYEDYLSSLDHRLAFLANMRNKNVPRSDIPALDTSHLAGSLADKKSHVHVDWLGSPTFTNGDWKQPDDPNVAPFLASKSTGWWMNWWGPAEAILRETFQRAIEVSLGLIHVPATSNGGALLPASTTAVAGNPPLSDITRFWSIDIIWTCGAPTLQGWVTWRKQGTGFSDGRVTITLATPGTFDVVVDALGNVTNVASNMFENPEPPQNDIPAGDDYKVDPGDVLDDIDAEAGMWIIGAKNTKTIKVVTTEDTLIGVWADVDINGEDLDFAVLQGTFIFPGSRHVATTHDIVTVRPSERHGGVKNSPRKF